MKNTFNLRFLLALALPILFGLSFTSCDDDAPEEENDSEMITSVVLTFTPQGGGTPIVASAIDADGDGPLSTVYTPATIDLSANTTYNVVIALANTLETPAEDITIEVQEEGDEHQLFYVANPTSLASISYNDQDENGLPIGVATVWTTGDSGSGNVSVTLKHQPGIKSSNSGINDGETDINVTFAIALE